MRDYKQMKEIQELRKQAETEEAAVPEETVSGETPSENDRYAHRAPGFKGWISHIWEYYKWPILIIGVILIGIIIGLRQALSSANPDLAVTYVGPFYLSVDNQNELRNEFAELAGENQGDFNGDGEFKCSLLDLTITYVRDAEQNTYVYDEQNSVYTRFQTELRAGDTLLYFLDQRYYLEAKGEGILQKLDTVLEDASLSFDGYGLYLGDLPCYSRPGFARMPAGTVVCLRQSPSQDAIRYNRTEDSWLNHVAILRAMVLDEKKEEKPAAGDDVTLFYASSEPCFRSYEEAIRSLAGPLTADVNGDGVRSFGVRSVCISGSDSEKELMRREAKTEMVTGTTYLWIVNEEMFRYAKERGLLEPLPEAFSSHAAAADGYGLQLSGIPLGNADGFSSLRKDSILCLRRDPAGETESYGRTSEGFAVAKAVFEGFLALTDKDAENG